MAKRRLLVGSNLVIHKAWKSCELFRAKYRHSFMCGPAGVQLTDLIVVAFGVSGIT